MDSSTTFFSIFFISFLLIGVVELSGSYIKMLVPMANVDSCKWSKVYIFARQAENRQKARLGLLCFFTTLFSFFYFFLFFISFWPNTPTGANSFLFLLAFYFSDVFISFFPSSRFFYSPPILLLFPAAAGLTGATSLFLLFFFPSFFVSSGVPLLLYCYS